MLTDIRAGVISMILCFAVGIANIVTFWKILIVVFGALCLSVSPPTPVPPLC
jgi:hypothetical protein